MDLNVNQSKSMLGFNATWSMAVGGMVGGGIFSTLGVVVGIAGAWAWLSFAAAILTFLFTFAVVCGLAFYQGAGARIITGFGVLAGATAAVVLIIRLIATENGFAICIRLNFNMNLPAASRGVSIERLFSI